MRQRGSELYYRLDERDVGCARGRSQSITLFIIGITEGQLATNVTVKGDVTLPKAVREAANIRPGDRVNVRVRPEGGVIIEADDPGRRLIFVDTNILIDAQSAIPHGQTGRIKRLHSLALVAHY
jgi:AbrB family looped-hinge helix DNA binding protein